MFTITLLNWIDHLIMFMFTDTNADKIKEPLLRTSGTLRVIRRRGMELAALKKGRAGAELTRRAGP